MGREVKRVPLDFGWPLKKIWEGYLCPWYKEHYHECDMCPEDERYGGRSGMTQRGYAHARNIELAYEGKGFNPLTFEDIAVLKEYYKDNPDIVFDTPREFMALARDKDCHDIYINEVRWIVLEAKAKREGWDFECPKCHGHGRYFDSEEWRWLCEEGWRKIDPPEGEGYQLWETTSEGSPVSPVFKSLEELAEWCEHNATVFAEDKATKEEWLAMFKDGFIASYAVDGQGRTICFM